jgi:NTP pyrophosphatase (non-canonical NTP hydrolase)
MATKKKTDAFDMSDSDYVKEYEERARKFAAEAQTEASYTVDEAKDAVEKMKNARKVNMKMEIDFEKYGEFVDDMTSAASKDTDKWIERITELKNEGVNISRLTTAAVGMTAEAGEFLEIVKKINFQGKPYDDANRDHMIIELGDLMWYIAQACMALEIGLDEVMWKNTMKLARRYPSGGFDVDKSENRAEGDL